VGELVGWPEGSCRAGRAGGMVKVGDKAPEFELLDQDSGSVSLSGLQGHKVLVYFYP
jgi:peroxiredoxin